LSFFDDEHDDDLPPTTVRPAGRTRRASQPPPRRPQRGAKPAADEHHAMLVRRRIAAVVGIALLILIVLLVNGCLKRGKQKALETYNQETAKIAQESTQIAQPVFAELSDAASKSAQEVEQHVNERRQQAQELAERAKKLSVPGEMVAAQRNLLLAVDLRREALEKIAKLVPGALGGSSPQATSEIAGDMEILLASDVLWSQRVAPLVKQALAAGGVSGQTVASSRVLPNVGWLEQKTVASRVSGKSSSSGPIAPGTHGHVLLGVSVGSNKLEPSPALNHISGGANPTFTVALENAGSDPETDVKVDVSVTSEGKTLSTSHLINKTEPAQKLSVDIPISGVALGHAARVTVNIEPVPGESDTENNKATYLAVFQP
jgi:hypothetical protein